MLLKIAPKTGSCAECAAKVVESATQFAAYGTVCGIHIQKIIYVLSKFKQLWNPQLEVESAKCKRNPHKTAESTYICRIRLQLRNPEQLLIFALADSAIKLMGRQILPYELLYTNKTEIL